MSEPAESPKRRDGTVTVKGSLALFPDDALSPPVACVRKGLVDETLNSTA